MRRRTAGHWAMIIAVTAGIGLWSARPPKGERAMPCDFSARRGDALDCGRGVRPLEAAKGVRPLGARAWLLGQPLDLNRARVGDVALLPGIGRRRARDIVATARRRGGFRRIAEVDAVSGVGPKTVARLRRFVTVRRISEDARESRAPGPDL